MCVNEQSSVTLVILTVHPSPFYPVITTGGSDEFRFWLAITLRMLSVQHVGLSDPAVGIQNTLALMKSMPHQIGCGRQHLKAINSQTSTESLMTTFLKHHVQNYTSGRNNCWLNGTNGKPCPLAFLNETLLRELCVVWTVSSFDRLLLLGIIWKWLLELQVLYFNIPMCLVLLSLKLSYGK